MGSNFKQIAFCLVAAAGGFALAITMMSGSEHEGSKNQVAKVAVLPADSNKAASTVSVAVNADGASEQAVDFDKIKERLGVDYDPMIFFASAEFSELEIQAYNELHVLPFNPVVDEVCSDYTSETYGNTVNRCERVRAFPEHPYATIPLEELSELAQVDPAAAPFMGKRSKNLDEVVDWHLRATALSGKPGPLMTLAMTRLPSVSFDSESRSLQPRDDTRLLRIAIEQVAQQPGNPRAKPDALLQQMQEEGANEAVLTSVSLATQTMLRKIEQIQDEVGVSSR